MIIFLFTTLTVTIDQCLRVCSRWLKSNIENARRLEAKSAPVRNDSAKLLDNIVAQYQLAGIRWACGWRGAHQLVALRSLEQLLASDEHYCSLLSGE